MFYDPVTTTKNKNPDLTYDLVFGDVTMIDQHTQQGQEIETYSKDSG